MKLQRTLLMSCSIGIALLTHVIVAASVIAQPVHNPENKTIVIESSSGPSELRLAKHLKHINAQVYTAFWCPHCHAQLSRFGSQAAQILNRIECDPQGQNAQPQLCREAKIEGFPTWIINGKTYVGSQSLEALANASGYQGPRQFKNLFP